jgi:hypothetical protein
MRRYLAVAFFLICGSTALPARALLTTPAEDSSLAGIKTVGLAVWENPRLFTRLQLLQLMSPNHILTTAEV